VFICSRSYKNHNLVISFVVLRGLAKNYINLYMERVEPLVCFSKRLFKDILVAFTVKFSEANDVFGLL